MAFERAESQANGAGSTRDVSHIMDEVNSFQRQTLGDRQVPPSASDNGVSGAGAAGGAGASNEARDGRAGGGAGGFNLPELELIDSGASGAGSSTDSVGGGGGARGPERVGPGTSPNDTTRTNEDGGRKGPEDGGFKTRSLGDSNIGIDQLERPDVTANPFGNADEPTRSGPARDSVREPETQRKPSEVSPPPEATMPSTTTPIDTRPAQQDRQRQTRPQ